MPWSFWAGYLEKFAVLGLALAALYFIAYGLRQTRLFARSGRCLTLLESIALSQHAALHVVRVGSRYFLIGSAAGGVRSIAELAEGEVGVVARR
jgi:flagellar biogenesis protein FliO